MSASMDNTDMTLARIDALLARLKGERPTHLQLVELSTAVDDDRPAENGHELPVPEGDETLIGGFDAHQAMRGFSANTLKRRRWTLSVFAVAVSEHGRTLGTATLDDVERFLGVRRSAQTRRSLLGDLRAFYKWASQRGHVDGDPTEILDMPRVPKRAPRPLSRTDLDRALSACNLTTVTGNSLRVAIMLGAYAGLRVSEIAALRWVDVDTDRGVIAVRNGKGGKDRFVPLATDLADALAVLDRRGDGRVIGTSGANVSQRIRKFFQRLGIDHRPHDLRVTFGTEACTASGGNVVVAAQLLGHTSIQTTMRYIGWTPDATEVVAAMFR